MNRHKVMNRSGGDRFLAFGAPLFLLVYYVIFLVVADIAADSNSAKASISPVIFTHETIEAADDAPGNMHTKTVGDIDGDGLPDIIVGGAGSVREGLYWYKNPTWTKTAIVPDDSGGTGFSTDMQVGDVDGDGDLDIVVPRANSSGTIGRSVTWFENPRPEGDPATDLWPEHNVGLGSSHDVELGDLNNDGLLDILVRNTQTTMFLQIDALTDQWTKAVINQRSVEGLAIADFDNDGDLDAATNGYYLENPLVPAGAAAMLAFWPERVIDDTRDVFSKTFASDINDDGQVDVLINTSEREGGELAWYEPSALGPAGGPWDKHTIGLVDYDHSIQTGDIDLDGDLDVIVAEMHQSDDSDNVLVYYNLDGAGTLWDFQVVDTNGSHNLRVIDIDVDGDLDIVGANWAGGPLSLWRSQAASLDSWERRSVDADRPWRAFLMDTADIDNDGHRDIVTGGWWYQNPGSPGGAWQRITIGSPLNNMAAVFDFDGDGDMDILGTGGTSTTPNADFVWAENDGTGIFTIHSNISAGDGDFLQGVAVGSITGADTEVFLSWHNNRPIQRLIVPDDPVNTPWPIDIASTVTEREDLSQGDIDGDLDIDLLLGTRWLENTPTGWESHVLFSTRDDPDRNELKDINGDGRLDAVIGYEAASVQGKLAWYEQGPISTELWTEHVISSTIIGPMSLDVRDMDSDGDFDVVAGEHNLATPAAARLIIYENVDGVGGSWTEHIVYTGDEHHDGARTADIDSDGDFDIVSIGWFDSPGGVFLYENTAGGSAPTPIATPDSYTLGQDTVLSVSVPGVMSNDIRPGGGFTASLSSNVSNGVLVLNADGSFTYTPAVAFVGGDSFEYTISNATETSPPGTVSLIVTGPNQPPTAVADGYSVSRGGAIRVASPGVLTNDTDPDGDPLQAQLVTGPSAGELDLNADGSFTYVHLGGAGTIDSFSYSAFDGLASSNTVTVSVSITPAVARESTGLLALYGFDEGLGSTVSDVSGVGAALDLTIASPSSTTWSAGALSVDSATLISSSGSATKIIDAVTTSGEITLEAWVKTGSASQSGPARIATLSADPFARNVTLGQDGTAFDVRLRTTSTDLNGVPSTASPVNSVGTALKHLVYTRDGSGNVVIYINGVAVQSSVVGGDLSNWDASYAFGLANELSAVTTPAEARPWLGQYRLVALYGVALTEQQVTGNFIAGPESISPPPAATISGMVTLQGVATGSAQFNIIGPQVTIDSGSGPQAVNVATDGSFSIPATPGTYTITAAAAGFLSQQRTGLLVSSSNVVMPSICLKSGLVDSDLSVTSSDLLAVMSDIAVTPVGRTNGSDTNIIDLNADGVISGLDSSLVAMNFGNSSPQTDW